MKAYIALAVLALLFGIMDVGIIGIGTEILKKSTAIVLFSDYVKLWAGTITISIIACLLTWAYFCDKCNWD